MHYESTKLEQNGGRGHRILAPNKLDLTFRALNYCAKFHQNQIKIAAVGGRTDRQTQVIL